MTPRTSTRPRSAVRPLRGGSADAAADHVPVDRKTLGAIAQVPRNVMKHAGRFQGADSRGGGPLERVVALVGIERAEFAAEDRLVVRDERRAPAPVVDDVELPAEVRVPHEARIFADEMLHADVKVEARQELDAGRLAGLAPGVCAYAGATPAAASASTTRTPRFTESGLRARRRRAVRAARRASSSSIRRFNSGRRLKMTDAFRHSRLSIAGIAGHHRARRRASSSRPTAPPRCCRVRSSGGRRRPPARQTRRRLRCRCCRRFPPAPPSARCGRP